MKEFVLLIDEGQVQALKPGQLEKMRQDYLSWMDEMIEAGRYVYGNRLETSSVTLSTNGEAITDGPYLEPKEMIGGIVIVRARDATEALDLARSCPMHRHHKIDVRESRYVFTK